MSNPELRHEIQTFLSILELWKNGKRVLLGGPRNVELIQNNESKGKDLISIWTNPQKQVQHVACLGLKPIFLFTKQPSFKKLKKNGLCTFNAPYSETIL